MIPIIVIASLVVGIVVGLWIKPTHLEFCSTCGASLECPACREVRDGAPRSRRTA